MCRNKRRSLFGGLLQGSVRVRTGTRKLANRFGAGVTSAVIWQPRSSGNRGHLTTAVIWQPRSSGNRGHLATAVFWQPRSSGNRGHLATAVICQPGSSGSRGHLAAGVIWQPGSSGSRGHLAARGVTLAQDDAPGHDLGTVCDCDMSWGRGGSVDCLGKPSVCTENADEDASCRSGPVCTWSLSG